MYINKTLTFQRIISRIQSIKKTKQGCSSCRKMCRHEARSKIVFLVRIELYGGFIWYILARKRKEKRKKGAPKSNSYQNHKICTTQKSRLLILSAAGALKALTTDQNTTWGKYGTLKEHQTNPENSSQKCSQRKTLALTDYKQGRLF